MQQLVSERVQARQLELVLVPAVESEPERSALLELAWRALPPNHLQ